jgi:MFS-type transporter involved in bile tolerance (Atg22 family)
MAGVARRHRVGANSFTQSAIGRINSPLRLLLLALFLLLVQTGALTHGVSHILDQHHADDPVCEQCLAFAAVGAGLASTPLKWTPPTQNFSFDILVPPAPPSVFRPLYQSRAPPRV